METLNAETAGSIQKPVVYVTQNAGRGGAGAGGGGGGIHRSPLNLDWRPSRLLGITYKSCFTFWVQMYGNITTGCGVKSNYELKVSVEIIQSQ